MKRRGFFGAVAGAVAAMFVKPKAVDPPPYEVMKVTSPTRYPFRYDRINKEFKLNPGWVAVFFTPDGKEVSRGEYRPGYSITWAYRPSFFRPLG
jgi:hypothetical protein